MLLARIVQGKRAGYCIIAALFFLCWISPAEPEDDLSTGQTVYVPVYANVFVGSKSHSFMLSALLSIRNTDPKFPLTVMAVDYYDSNGKMVRSYIKEPLELKPLASTHYYIPDTEKSAGPGAKFIVKWQSIRMINKPIIEALMIGSRSGQGISFTSPGREISEYP